ncbi:AraC family transcriptional regulator [Escherichia coli]|uniref:helix-turn-helix domain-containing protein n=1 Tax=Escherichia coli TaxID=562 RepID=UPI000543ADC9|nr:helix-turn-helix domain-containing protein [Escherichia coli]EFO0769485.1 AraC family transcriptional regulator [Escherichia coli]EFT2923683.1 AraC family transcriptional regulator [Escherichia coli]EGH1135829.1 AraC family transcriptional regulator [Escherichia coli]ELP0956406.1 AraC family transcriptional regulator [Escherichia coli]KHH87806.1 AraC family transcriptional regulator [Escherichia coli]
MFVCSVILVNHPFETDFAGKRLFLQKNDVLLADDVSKSLFLHHPGNVTELRIDECIVRKYLESADRIQYSDTPVPVPFIKTSFTLPSLLHDIVINLSRHNTLPQQFSEQMFFACLSIFSTHRGFMPMLFKCINSVALKVGYIICSSPSRAWKIKDISNALYMSESLLKRKLREEKTSFSQILLDIRMHNARQLVFSKLSVNQISIRCGYASTAYFISVFRQYYGITPCQMLINQTMSVENRPSAQRSMPVSV